MEHCRSVLETEELSASLQAIEQQLALQERLRPQVGPTYHGLSRFSDQQLDAMIVAGKKREEELEANLAALRDPPSPTIEAAHAYKDPATKRGPSDQSRVANVTR
jgi:hypothetical protein